MVCVCAAAPEPGESLLLINMNSLNKYVSSPGAQLLEYRHLAQLIAFFITSAALVCMFYGKIIKL